MDLEKKNVLKAAITALGGYTPETILSNHKLEQMVDTSDEWIQSRTGIKERRILADSDKATSFLAIKAAEDLIKKTSLDPKTIELIILATLTPDIHVAAYIISVRYREVLLFGAVKISAIVDDTDRTSCSIFGDAGGAVLFEPSSSGFGWEDE